MVQGYSNINSVQLHEKILLQVGWLSCSYELENWKGNHVADKTKIAWTEHTWNPWRGCRQVSAGCAHCYAKHMLEKRYSQFGFKPTLCKSTWDNPARWNRKAARSDQRPMVFVCSWSDFFIEEADDDWRQRAWQIIRDCRNLTFQILTKRPERIMQCLPENWGSGYSNVWLGVSCESAQYTGRIDLLRDVPARVRFVSYEPALGPLGPINLEGIHWLIAGGESGPNFRPDNDDWYREIRDHCEQCDVAFFFKQHAGSRQGTLPTLDGEVIQQYPQLT